MTASRKPILALDASSSRCSAVLWLPPVESMTTTGTLLGCAERAGPTGEAALLPGMVVALLNEAHLAAAELGAIAVAVGPGSFTGLRASLALAEGLAVGAAIPVIGVSVAEALALAARAADPALGDLPLWCALDARQGRVFLHRGGAPEDWMVAQLDQPPLPEGPIALTGDAAEALGLSLQAAGASALITAARHTHAQEIAIAATLRAEGLLPPLATAPLYIDPPRALLPRGGLRPPPRAAEPVT